MVPDQAFTVLSALTAIAAVVVLVCVVGWLLNGARQRYSHMVGTTPATAIVEAPQPQPRRPEPAFAAALPITDEGADDYKPTPSQPQVADKRLPAGAAAALDSILELRNGRSDAVI